MAWTTSKKVNKYELGDNVLKGRIVPQERIDFIEENAPKEIVNRNAVNLKMANQINDISNKSNEHVAALKFIRTLITAHTYCLETKLFQDDYEDTLFEIYKSYSDLIFEFDILLEVINDVAITEDLFMFCLIKNKNNSASIVITPAAIWEDEHRIHPITYNQILPDWLVEEYDNVYLIVDGITMAEARRKMINSGFIENPELSITKFWL